MKKVKFELQVSMDLWYLVLRWVKPKVMLAKKQERQKVSCFKFIQLDW